MSSSTRPRAAESFVTTMMAIALAGVVISASRLAFVLVHPQPKTGLLWLFVPVVALVVVFIYCNSAIDFSWTNDRIVFGLAALLLTCVAVSRLMLPFLKNPQPRTAFFWLVAAAIALVLGLIFKDD